MNIFHHFCMFFQSLPVSAITNNYENIINTNIINNIPPHLTSLELQSDDDRIKAVLFLFVEEKPTLPQIRNC
jgi:hypothetical protein